MLSSGGDLESGRGDLRLGFDCVGDAGSHCLVVCVRGVVEGGCIVVVDMEMRL